MGKQRLYVEFPRAEKHRGNQPVAVMPQIEDQYFADEVRAWERAAYIGEATPISGARQAIPIQRFDFRIRTLGGELEEAAFADDVQVSMLSKR
jgi:hypothetical protein